MSFLSRYTYIYFLEPYYSRSYRSSASPWALRKSSFFLRTNCQNRPKKRLHCDSWSHSPLRCSQSRELQH